MVTESHFEKDFVVKYFEDDLGYESMTSTVFSSDQMLIPSVVQEFVFTHNHQTCKEIIRKEFNGDAKPFFRQLCQELSAYMYHNPFNVAIQLNPKKHNGFKFMNQYSFNLYLPFNQASEDRNVYTVMRQPSFKIPTLHGPLSIIPDIGIFINGFLVSFLQLKLQHRGQSAEREGRAQVIGDYLESIKRCVIDPLQTNKGYYETTPKAKDDLIHSTLKYFHAPIHMVSMDTQSAYIIRGIERHYPEIEKLYLTGKANDAELKKDITKTFYLDAVYKKETLLELSEKCKKVLFNLYHKNNLQSEIMYFNFLSYERVSNYKDGKKTVGFKTRTPILSYPRPNQKYGVEKVVAEVIQKYHNEHNVDYEVQRLDQRLIDLQIPETIRQKALEKRKAYKNNRNQFSILLQYAAGFGKTYILCWLALMLKDLMENAPNNAASPQQAPSPALPFNGNGLSADHGSALAHGELPTESSLSPSSHPQNRFKRSNRATQSNPSSYLFNKIFIISDRVDLRDQVDRAMHNMNIEKSLFAEADNRDKLKQFLTSKSPRIVIVNIQKFPFLKDMLDDAELSALRDHRTAFLIDEIHRSNSGAQHQTMTSIFDDIADAMAPSPNNGKKNLIIGLTATPTDENLARFGEFQGCLEDIKWTPFDAYTMTEAIDDGFVLDPTKSLIPCAVELQYCEEDQKRMPSAKDIYENEDRLRAIAKKTAEILVTTTYKKIYGQGKAMLACYSINAAKKYYDYITEELALLTEQPKYANYKEAKVYIVYTHNQEDSPAHVVCGHPDEKSVISAFKADKNGLMIVVDKLQTGFDEPKLHTLFLDKEVKGINAVQTVCRVNRTHKHKEDCLVVDYSIDNHNIGFIRHAFEKFAGIVASEFDSYHIKTQAEELYRKIIATTCYLKFFAQYQTQQHDIAFALQLQQYIQHAFQHEHGKTVLLNDCESYMTYIQKLGLIDNVIGIDAKYKDETLLCFLRDLINLIKGTIKDNSGSKVKEAVDFWFENLGIIESSQIELDSIRNKKKESKAHLTAASAPPSEYSILDQIRQKNQDEKNKETLMAEYLQKLTTLFDHLIDYDQTKNDGRLGVRINHIEQYTNVDISDQFKMVFKITVRRIKNNPAMLPFIQEIESNVSLLEADFIKYFNKMQLQAVQLPLIED